MRSAARWGLVCRPLEPLARHVFTTRSWLLGSASGPDAWREVAEALGTDPGRLLRVRQVHGADVLVHRAGRPPDSDAAADIIAGDDASVALAIQTADCVPLLIGDLRTGAVAAAHAGWRGTALRRRGRRRQRDDRPSSAAAPRISLRPWARRSDPAVTRSVVMCASVSRTRASADAELARWFSTDARHLPANPPMVRSTARGRGGSAVPGSLERDARSAGERPVCRRDQIFVAELCTASHAEVFCSYRRDGKDAGRLAAVIRSRESRLPADVSHGAIGSRRPSPCWRADRHGR